MEFQAVRPTVGNVFRTVFVCPTHPPVLLRESVAGERIIAAIRNFA